MLTLRRKTAVEPTRAPDGTECTACNRTEPGTSTLPVVLARCSVCETWLCSGACFSQHAAPAAWYQDVPRSWWKRVLGRG